MTRWSWAVGLALFGCDASKVDPGDVDSVFSPPSASAEAPALSKPEPAANRSAKNAKDAGARVVPRERAAVKGPCVAASGEKARLDPRPARRPACRRSQVIESRDVDGTPRYACVFTPTDVDERKPLPLVVFLHGAADDPRAVHEKTKLRTRYHKLDMTGDPRHEGFVVIAPQARHILLGSDKRSSSMRWDVDYTAPDNVDVATLDGFVDGLVSQGLVDVRQIYALGDGRGGTMAMLYSMLRPDRIAAAGVYAASPIDLRWSCDAEPTPVGVIYRSCDAQVPCAGVERWLSARDDNHMQTWSVRLGAGNATEPSCAASKDRCKDKKGAANHARWPKAREGELLEYLSRYSLLRAGASP